MLFPDSEVPGSSVRILSSYLPDRSHMAAHTDWKFYFLLFLPDRTSEKHPAYIALEYSKYHSVRIFPPVFPRFASDTAEVFPVPQVPDFLHRQVPENDLQPHAPVPVDEAYCSGSSPYKSGGFYHRFRIHRQHSGRKICGY